MSGFFVHGYDKEVADDGTCDRCERLLQTRGAYHVSHSGERATHRICAGCHSYLKSAYGCRAAEQGTDGG